MVNKKSISLCMVVYNPYISLIHVVDSVDEIIDEIVIVDQGSDEKESALIKTFLEGKEIGGKSVVYHKTTNKGNADYDRQFCYNLASKEYILAMDADEIIRPDELKKLVSLLEKYDFELTWFLFVNKIKYNGKEIDLKPILADDPHPRLWKKITTFNKQPIPTLIWSNEAHKFPQINT